DRSFARSARQVLPAFLPCVPKEHGRLYRCHAQVSWRLCWYYKNGDSSSQDIVSIEKDSRPIRRCLLRKIPFERPAFARFDLFRGFLDPIRTNVWAHDIVLQFIRIARSLGLDHCPVALTAIVESHTLSSDRIDQADRDPWRQGPLRIVQGADLRLILYGAF